jgi:hypothetical protein
MYQLEEQVSQRAKASELGRDDLTAAALDRLRGLQAQLEELSRQHAEALVSEERLFAASQRLQSKVDAFRASSPELSELRPGAPATAGIRILFAVKPPDTAILLAAGTERDWLRTWYAATIRHCRARYERDQGSAG